ncbi:MAG TPA: hypothetical protein VMS56_06085 [Thermoanaerobaculia bacterium]|nr:hypothetical protein [Thermoanaerobaculia bacterium]
MSQAPLTPGVPPPPPYKTPQKRGWGKWVAIGCVALALLAAAISAAIWFGLLKATEGPEQAVREFLDAAAAGDYQTAHEYFSAPLKQVQPLDQFEAMVAANSSFFAVTDATFPNRSVDTSGAELSGTVTLESGTEMPAQFKLVREGGEWKLISYNIGS